MISHHPAKFDGHRQCGSREIMFLVVAWQDSSALAYSPPPPPSPLAPITVYLYLYHMTWKHRTYHVDKSHIGYTRLKQEKNKEKNSLTVFVSPSKNIEEKERKSFRVKLLCFCQLP